ncbi:hypothetical protein LIER_00688 [Lithospermum erythrorhizon]|uniref:Uncharacterized protein n=1 Tax=Lithospermum erythrorhizon TaxID=34254 RepID=A0AAV3NIA5_LITER
MASGSHQRPSSIPQDNLAPVVSESVPQRPDSPVLDVARSIAKLLNDTREESLLTTEVFSIEPLAVRHPETVPANPHSTHSSAPAAPPSTHGAGAV